MPMKAHENILVFYDNLPTFNPQKTSGHKPINTYTKKAEVCNKTEIYGKVNQDVSGGGETDRYPRSVQLFSSDKQKTKNDGTIHPTQKPLALIEMLVKTYSNEGDLILDNTMGSGTLPLACIKNNRKFIGIEKEEKYYNISIKRINNYLTELLFTSQIRNYEQVGALEGDQLANDATAIADSFHRSGDG
jgi:site-specific DNA-methyltransferase (adenine-specific)